MNNSFRKNVTKLISGGVAAQLIALFAMPFVTRMYSPEALGYQGLLISITMVLAIVSTLGYHYAINVVSEEDSFEVLKLSLFLSFVFFVILMLSSIVLCYFYREDIYLLLMILALPFSVFSLAVMNCLEQYSYAVSKFSVQPISSVAGSISNQGIKLAGGVLGANATYLYISVVLSTIIRCVLIIYMLPQSVKCILKNKYCHFSRYSKMYADFPKYRMPQTFISSAAMNMPIFAFSIFYSSDELGQLSLSIAVLGFSLVLGSSLTSVINSRLRQISESEHKRFEIFNFVKFFTFKAIFILTPFFLISYLIIKYSYSFVFGDGWLLSSWYAGVLLLQYYCVIVTRAVVSAFTILELNRHLFHYDLVNFILKVAVSIFLGLHCESKVFILVFSLFSSLGYMFLYVYLALIIRSRFSEK